MRSPIRKSVPLGEMVVAAFDVAADYNIDPREVSRLATHAIALMLRFVQRASISPPILRPVPFRV